LKKGGNSEKMKNPGISSPSAKSVNLEESILKTVPYGRQNRFLLNDPSGCFLYKHLRYRLFQQSLTGGGIC